MRIFSALMAAPPGWHVMPAAPRAQRRPVEGGRAPPVECYGLLVDPTGSIVARIFGHEDEDRWPIVARIVDNAASYEVRGWCGAHAGAEDRALMAFGFMEGEVS